MTITDFPARRARDEAVRLAVGCGYCALVTMALVREAVRRTTQGTPPVIAARAVVKRPHEQVAA